MKSNKDYLEEYNSSAESRDIDLTEWLMYRLRQKEHIIEIQSELIASCENIHSKAKMRSFSLKMIFAAFFFTLLTSVFATALIHGFDKLYLLLPWVWPNEAFTTMWKIMLAISLTPYAKFITRTETVVNHYDTGRVK